MSALEPNPLDNCTIRNIREISNALGIPGFERFLKRATVSTYEQFVSVLYEDLDDIIAGIQENPELRLNDDENRLTIDIVSLLKAWGYDADHDRKIGGHTDISVRGRNNYLWIGEAKIHGAYDELYGGFQQLCTRYSTGDHNQDRGGLIIYIRAMNATNVVYEWRERFQHCGLAELVLADCPTRPDLAFYSTHKHERSGRNFSVRHVGVMLYFKPKDADKDDKLPKPKKNKAAKSKSDKA